MTFETVLIIVQTLTLLFVIILRTKSQQSNNLSDFKLQLKEYIELMSQNLKEKLTDLTQLTRERLDRMSEKVDKKLDQGFQKTNDTFAKIIERMAKIDQAQKNIEKLSHDVVGLQNILNDSKRRGVFGEVQLEHIITNVFGDNTKLYEMQYHFQKENVMVDCVVKTPQGLIPIDAKFPLTNYQKLSDDQLSADEKKQSEKLFLQGVKKQIDEIANKYILPPKTIPTAFMFVPAEAIFADLHSHYYDIIDYAHSRNVNIVSPTTLLAMLTIVLSAIQSQETQRQAKIIQDELGKLSTEFGRFTTRRGKFTKDFHSVGKDITDIDITSGKIIQKFEKIEKLEFEEQEKLES